MTDVNSRDNIGFYQLKECYALAEYFEKLDTAKEILRIKGKKINISSDYIHEDTITAHGETEMQIISEALQELSLEGNFTTNHSEFKYTHKINMLPDSAEKEYLLALLSLRNETNETQRIEAIKHITHSLSVAPNDPRYLALASVLQRNDKRGE